MKRVVRKPHYPTNQVGKFGRLATIARIPVNPGETFEKVAVNFRLNSIPIESPLTGARLEVWGFYVPYRLCWDDWIDYITGDSSKVIPTTSVAAELHGEFASGYPDFYSKALQAVVNEYFRTDEDSAYSYDPTEQPVLPNYDMTAEMLGSKEEETLDETIDVSGGTLSVTELHEAEANLRAAKRSARLDGRYTSYLQQFGVNVRDDALEVPEHCYYASKFIQPSKAIDPATGYPASNYIQDVKAAATKRRIFQEFGEYIVFAALRPKVIIRGGNMALKSMVKSTDWPHPHQSRDARQIDVANSLGGDNTAKTQTVDDAMLRGQVFAGADTNWSLNRNPNTLGQARFPDTAWDALPVSGDTELGGQHFELNGQVSAKIITPIRFTPTL